MALRLQKAFESLAAAGHGDLRETAIEHARMALIHAENKLDHPHELAALRTAAEANLKQTPAQS